ncbi:helix-turn-helix domain-containing protein [Frankia sp. Mgl5]|uniref:helix-turn-helix domain-containing protein n=1 Tax=Frankia sp. Mgl5 TaxID=2933793 RepID=UPI00200E5D07|nr:helix-turn-helix transcriptional regulator [Frankia sp. Mgl5]MCK9932422.1 helix-turn-helix domain-containing protein [Frankia sp. Mgl5]
MRSPQHQEWRPDLLRRAREIHGLTLEEAAEKIRALDTQGFRPPNATFQMIGRHERGEVSPGRRYQRAYSMIYQASASELGFPPSGLNPLDRPARSRAKLWSQPLHQSAGWTRRSSAELEALAAAALSTDAPDAISAARLAHEWLLTPPPQIAELTAGRRIGVGLARQVEGRVAQLRRLDDYVGGPDLIDLVTNELTATTTLLREGTYSETIARTLLGAVGELGQLAGWVAADAGRHESATRFLITGLRAAHAAADTPLAANLISTLSYQLANAGDPAEAVLLAQTACTGAATTVTPATRALLTDRLAWAHARVGDTTACERSLADVETHYDQHTDTDDDPEWIYWMNQREIDVMAGRCWTELNQPDRAEPRLLQGLAGYQPIHAREVALYESWLAESYIQTGDITEAARRTTHVVELDAKISSTRTADRIQILRARLTPYADQQVVQDLNDLCTSYGYATTP